MKRILAMLLALCTLVSLAACGGAPAATTEQPAAQTAETPAAASAEATAETGFTAEQYQKAAQEVAMAFYNKNPNTEYEARNLTALGKWGGAMRNMHGVAPEYVSDDSQHFGQCTDFIMDVYINAYGYHMFDDKVQPTTGGDFPSIDKNDPGVVLYWTPESEMSVNDMAKKVVEIMQAGDVLIGNGDTTPGNSSGHAILCVGDVFGDGKKYTIDDAGKALPSGTKEGSDRADAVDASGSLHLEEVNEFLLANRGDGRKFSIRSESHNKFYIMVYRPYTASDFTNTITPATLSRMKYSGIEIDRRPAGLTKYNDLVTGEKVTFELEIINNSKEAYQGLPVSEIIPDGATLDAASVNEGGKADGKTVSWTLDIPAGGSKILTYTMKIDAPNGTLLTFPEGKVDNIPTRELTMMVGGKHFTEEQYAAIAKFAETQQGFSFKGTDSMDLSVVTAFYKQVLGIDLTMPESFDTYRKDRFERKEIQSMKSSDTEELYVPRENFAEKFPELAAMEMYQHIGGLYVAFENEGYNSPYRMLDLKEEFYQPGDVIITMWYTNRLYVTKPEYAAVYIYLGKDKVMSLNADGEVQIQTYVETLNCLLRNNLFVGLRPTLAYADINNK